MGTRSQGRAARGQADVGPPAGPVRRAVLAVDATTLIVRAVPARLTTISPANALVIVIACPSG